MQQISDSDVIENMWVIVIYKEEKFLGRVLEKRNSEYLVKCLQKPLGIREPQEMEKDAIFYEKIIILIFYQVCHIIQQSKMNFGFINL